MELWSSFPLLITLSLALAAPVLFLLHSRHGGRKKPLPPGPPALLFVARFLALRRSVFHLAPLLRDLHARYGPVVSVRLSRTLVFVADRRIAHRVLVQGGSTFADRPPLGDPGLLFTSGGRDISTSPYGSYWRMVRRNLAAEALHPARVALYAPARRRARDALVHDLLRAPGGGVAVRPAFRRAMFELLVYMSLGARLGPETLDEVQELQLRILRSITSFPIFSFFPALTKRLFRRRWAGYVAVRRRQDEIFLPLIHARRERHRDGSPPCYADSPRPRAHGRRGGLPLLRVPERRHRHDGHLSRVDHGGAGEPPGHTIQGVRGGESKARARRRPAGAAGDTVPEGGGAGVAPAASAGALPPPARRAERRRGGRRPRGAQGRGGQLPGRRLRARRGGVDGSDGVPAGAVLGRRRGARRGPHGEQGDQDDALRCRTQDVPRVRARPAARGVLRRQPREGAGMAAGGGGGGGGHDRGAGFHHRHEASAPCTPCPKE